MELNEFKLFLNESEKCPATTEKYLRDIQHFFRFASEKGITKELVIEYKQSLADSGYKTRSINSMLASLNCYFDFIGRYDCKVKTFKLQQELFRPEEKELTRAEYERLIKIAEKHGDNRISLVIQTICGTGIRVSELQFITVEAAKRGFATVNCKGKTRKIFIVRELQKKLNAYAKANGIKSGTVFITKGGKPLDRSNIWRKMKELCKEARVSETKVFPHNLRHLFARVFYAIKHDIAKLADVLGHSSINTTRIYIVSTGEEHRRYMENMKLVI